jgi:hypothetical protein
MSDIVPQSGGSKRDWFSGVIRHFESATEADRAELAVKAAGIWIGYPLFGEVIECLPDTTDEEKYALRGSLNLNQA